MNMYFYLFMYGTEKEHSPITKLPFIANNVLQACNNGVDEWGISVV